VSGSQHDELFKRLQGSRFRSRFHLEQKERAYLAARRMDTVLQHAQDFVARKLAPAQPNNDGKQTPMRGHPVFVAQHATATCCRGCLEKWHGMARGRPLTSEEQRHIVSVIARWLQDEAADLSTRSRPQTGPKQGSLF
jgi:hypothetical protein